MFYLLDLLQGLGLEGLVREEGAVAHETSQLLFDISDAGDEAEGLAEDASVPDEGKPGEECLEDDCDAVVFIDQIEISH